MNREASPPIAHTREAHGFTLSIIDTGGITEVDLLSTAVSHLSHGYICLCFYAHEAFCCNCPSANIGLSRCEQVIA